MARQELSWHRPLRDILQALWRAKERRHHNYDAAIEESLYCTEEERIARQQQTFAEAQEQLRLKHYVRSEVDPRGPPIGWVPEAAHGSRRAPLRRTQPRFPRDAMPPTCL